MENMSKWALIFAIIGLVCNILMISISGVPVSVPLGIFGIAFSILCKDPETRKLSKKGTTALILSIVALVFGLLIYAITLVTTNAMADPVMSRAIIDTFKSLKDQMPEDMQQMFEQAGIPLE